MGLVRQGIRKGKDKKMIPALLWGNSLFVLNQEEKVT